MFDRDLFYSLCDKYGVELSDQYDRPMLKADDGLREITEADVKNLMPQFQEVFLYCNKIELCDKNIYMPEDLLIA